MMSASQISKALDHNKDRLFIHSVYLKYLVEKNVPGTDDESRDFHSGSGVVVTIDLNVY